jgi:hypothetical protein
MALDILQGSNSARLDSHWPFQVGTPLLSGTSDQECPSPLTGSLTWDGAIPSSLKEFTLSLGDVDVSEVCSALEYFHGMSTHALVYDRKPSPNDPNLFLTVGMFNQALRFMGVKCLPETSHYLR